MSIQSTIELTRKEAEERCVFKQMHDEERKHKLEIIASHMNTVDLENGLETTFDNFRIID